MPTRNGLKEKRAHDFVRARLTLFMEENWQGLLKAAGILFLLIALLVLLPLYGHARRARDYERLVIQGERGTGTIVGCELISGNRAFDWPATPALFRVTIEYQSKAGEKQKNEEYWPVYLGDQCEQGGAVTVYSLAENKLINLASANNQEIRRAIKTLTGKAGRR